MFKKAIKINSEKNSSSSLHFALKLRQLFFERLNVGLNFSQRKISILKNKLIVRYITKLIITSICNPNVIQGSL